MLNFTVQFKALYTTKRVAENLMHKTLDNDDNNIQPTHTHCHAH